MMRRFALCAWLAVVLANASCTAPTQVILEIDAEEELRAEISSVRLQMESTNEPFTAPEDRPFSPRQWPFTTVLAPLNRDATRRYRVQATATTPRGPIVARATSGFAPGRSWTLRLRFETSCLDVDCEADLTCRRGSCVSAVEPVEGVEDGGVDAGGVDSPMSFDGGPVDASGDTLVPPDVFVTQDTFVAPDATCEPSDMCGTSSCRDLNTDPENCGVCGRECAWGRCVGGMCDDPVEISVGTNHACAVRRFGELVCWGLNGAGQLGDGSTTNRSDAVTVPVSGSVSHVATGESHTCATTSSGVWCWGLNDARQLGPGAVAAQSLVPVLVMDVPAGATRIAAGLKHTCVVSGTAVYCWGRNGEYQTGHATSTADQPTPQVVPELPAGAGPISMLVAGSHHNCVRYTDGSLWCWGDNGSGQLGRGETTIPMGNAVPEPVRVGVTVPTTGVATSGETTCASSASGIQCWGYGRAGALGDGMDQDSFAPRVASTLMDWELHMSGTTGTMCAVSGSRLAHCWGLNDTLQAGQPGAMDVLAPQQVSGPVLVAEVRSGGTFSCARMLSGHVFCWGANEYGQLGNGSTSVVPTAVPTRVLPPAL